MRIAINAAFLDTRPTGIGIYTLEILKRMSFLEELREHEVHVYSPMAIHGLHEHFKVILLPSNLARSTQGPWNALRRHYWNWKSFPTIAKNYDLVYAPSHNSGLIPHQIITVHDLIAIDYPQQHWMQFLFFRFRLPSLLRSAQNIIAVSNSTKNALIHFYRIDPNRIHVIYNGVNPPLLSTHANLPHALKPKSYLLCVGATLPHKNLEVVIRSLVHTNFQLAITGNTNAKYKHKLDQLSKNIGVQDRIHWLGYCDPPQLQALYTYAHALAYPSLCEGFGIPVPEAQSMGCPVIISNKTSLPEVGGEGVLSVEATDPVSWTKALLSLNNPEIRRTLIQRGFANAKRFSWEQTAFEITQILLSKPRS